MKKFRMIVVLLIVALIMPFATSSAAAESMLYEQTVTALDSTPNAVLTTALQEKLVAADKNELIPVTIRLNDSIDLDAVEQKAITWANLSAAEKAILSADTTRLSEKESQAHQLEALTIRDRIYVERLDILEEYYGEKNSSFIAENGLSDAQIGSVGVFTPYIRDVLLTKEQIKALESNEDVCFVDYTGYITDSETVSRGPVVPPDAYPSINDTYQIVNGDVCVENGYTGSGIRVGMVDSYHPIASVVGGADNGIYKAGGVRDTENSHPTMVCGIIKKFAPDCSIYSRTVGRPDDVLAACFSLIQQENPVHVINLSWGPGSSGEYDAYSYEMNDLVKNTKVTVVVAAGNDSSSEAGGYVNCFGMAPNVITVGGVVSYGTNQGASNAYDFYTDSSYEEKSNVINKPEVCAPAFVEVYGYENHGTSFAAPHVTGTVVQMMSRNVGLTNKPETLKAILMASASYNAGTGTNYVTGTEASNKEGAGVIDAGFCYQVAHNGRRTHFDANANTEVYTHNVYCDTTSVPFRVACAWETELEKEGVGANAFVFNLIATDFDMEIWKNGTWITSSTASTNSTTSPTSNYEIIELSTSELATYGAGYYQVKIVIKEDCAYNNGVSVRIGLAWEQR